MKYYGVKAQYVHKWTNDDVIGLVVDENELNYLAKAWDKPVEELLEEVELLEEDEIVVFASNGQPALPKQSYLAIVYREMCDWWKNTSDEERSEFGTLNEFIKQEIDNWVAEDKQYTFMDVWKEAHEEH